jgi:hypothetical protein
MGSEIVPQLPFQKAPFFSFDTVHQIVELPAGCPWADWERPVLMIKKLKTETISI